MAHEHGPHVCYCPSCNYRMEVAEYIKCNTIACPVCGARMRAVETGERRISTEAISNEIIPIDDQPIDAGLFGEVRRLTSWITPNALEVESLYKNLTKQLTNQYDKIVACWKWVASQVKYVKFVKSKVWLNGKTFVENDLWQDPSAVINTRIGNCVNKSFLLTSLLRNILPDDQVYCSLGNLYNGKPGGHAWLELRLPDGAYVMESTSPTAPPLVPVDVATRYEAVHYFNERAIYAVEGRTVLTPFTACYSEWLSSYLHWAYMRGQGSD